MANKPQKSNEKYNVMIDEYKGSPILQIWSEESSQFPVISFGIKKARAIHNCISDIEKFIQDNEV